MTALDFPANPTVGQVFGRWTFDGIAWTLNPSEASLGNGIVGFGESAGTIPLTTTPVDLLTTPVTFNAVAGRRYLLMGVGAMSSGASIISLLTIHSNIAGEGDVASGSSTGGAGLTFPQAVALAIYAPAVTGPVSLMLRGASASGTGNSVQSSSAPRFLMVEDITPSAGIVAQGGTDPAAAPLAQTVFYANPTNLPTTLPGTNGNRWFALLAAGNELSGDPITAVVNGHEVNVQESGLYWVEVGYWSETTAPSFFRLRANGNGMTNTTLGEAAGPRGFMLYLAAGTRLSLELEGSGTRANDMSLRLTDMRRTA